MQTYWLTFTDGTQAPCDGQNAYDAKVIAEKLTGKTVAGGKFEDIAAETLPYPTRGMIWHFEHPVNGKCPAFCHKPKSCAGRTACPNRPSCTD